MVAGRILLKIVYLLTCRVPGMTLLVFHGDQPKDAGCWCSGMRTRCCATMSAGCGTSRLTGVWFAALARLGPRRRWTGVFRVTPATLRP
jgi:hypothetical protein